MARWLLYAAEDALHVVRQRLHGIAHAAGVEFAALDIQVITAPSLRLDLAADQARLRATVEALRPTLLVLDPAPAMPTLLPSTRGPGHRSRASVRPGGSIRPRGWGAR